MKTILLISLTIACTATLFAESPGGEASLPPLSQPDGGAERNRKHGKMMETLPPELRERFDNARAKVMQDPAMQELKKKADESVDAFRKAMREAMIKADPDLEKVIQEKMQQKNRHSAGQHGKEPGFSQLSENDRKKLMSARETAKQDPTIQALETKKKEAKTPEERRAAAEELRQAMRTALLQADPTLAPILEQLHPPQASH